MRVLMFGVLLLVIGCAKPPAVHKVTSPMPENKLPKPTELETPNE